MHVLKLIYRNALCHKLRTFLTIFAVSVALLGFSLLRTVITTWYLGVKTASSIRLITRNAVSLVFSLPIYYKDQIRQVEGVREVSYGSWFGGIYIDEKHFFANYAVEPSTYLKIYPEIILPHEQLLSVLNDRRAAVVGRKLAERYNWKIGDVVTLKGTIYPGNWEFVIRGVYKGRDENVDETAFFFHWDYLNETIKRRYPYRADQVGWFMVEVKSPDIAGEVLMSIDRLFKNSIAETLTETERAFTLGFIAMTEAIVIAIKFVSYVIIGIILIVVANTMSMTTRERIGEYSIFKTLGFGSFHISGLILGESLLITMLGACLGIILTFPAAKIFAYKLRDYFPVFNVESETIYIDVIIAFFVAVIGALFPTWKALRVKVADGLRMIG